MAVEIERRYLLLPLRVEFFLRMFKMDFRKINITQNYIKRDEQLGRVRQFDDKYYITIKKGDGLVREEYEKEITEEIYNNILNSSDETKTISKTRYLLDIDGFTYEIDEFQDALCGLVLLEVEFENEKESLDFKINDTIKKVVVKEVTEDRKFDNSSIAASQSVPYL